MELDKAIERIVTSEGLKGWIKFRIAESCPISVKLEELEEGECSNENCAECWLKAFGCDME